MMLHLWRLQGKETSKRRTGWSEKAKVMTFGFPKEVIQRRNTRNPRNPTRTLMPAGQRNAVRITRVARIMSR